MTRFLFLLFLACSFSANAENRVTLVLKIQEKGASETLKLTSEVGQSVSFSHRSGSGEAKLEKEGVVVQMTSGVLQENIVASISVQKVTSQFLQVKTEAGASVPKMEVEYAPFKAGVEVKVPITTTYHARVQLRLSGEEVIMPFGAEEGTLTLRLVTP